MEMRPTPSISDGIVQTPSAQSSVDTIQVTTNRNSSSANSSSFPRREFLPPSGKSSLWSPVFQFWRKEVGSYLVAFLALTAIILILATSDKQPLQQRPGPFTTNSLVAIFTAILKSAMLMPIAEGIGELKWLWFTNTNLVTDVDQFDIASRGPRGSLQFLFRLPRNKLASLGALITILALGIDPFTQQIIQDRDCPWPTTDVASIRRTNNYTAAGWHGPSIPPIFKLDGKMSAALYVGTLDPQENATSGEFYTCPSRFCKFSPDKFPYTSLAMCTSIDDISTQIVSGKAKNTWNLPSGFEVRDRDPDVTFRCGRTQRSASADSPYFELEALMLVLDCENDQPVEQCDKKPWAFRASLHPCIQTYSDVSISSSQLEQKIISTTNLPLMNVTARYYSLAGDHPATAGVDCSPAMSPSGTKGQATHRLKTGQDYVVPRPDQWAGDSPDNDIALSQDVLWYDPACTYEFGVGPTNAIQNKLSDLFGMVGNGTEQTASKTIYSDGRDNNGIRVETDDPWLDTLYANGRVNFSSARRFLEGLADAMSVTMRVRGDNSNSLALDGDALAIKTCVHVQWAWLALDVALIVSTAVFLSLTIWRARKALGWQATMDGRGSWKSSSLPLLWCGLSDVTREKNGVLNSTGQMERQSDLLEVKLLRTGEAGSESQINVEEEEEAEEEDEEESQERHGVAGRWVLQAQRELRMPEKLPRIRRWGFKFGKYMPV